jgi:hypothetical protein
LTQALSDGKVVPMTQPVSEDTPYVVEALEKFIVRTKYYVRASSPEAAEQLCKQGKVAYDDSSIEEGEEEWVETVRVDRL